MNTDFYCKTVEQALGELKSDINCGLATAEAKQRLVQNGPNRLQGTRRKSLLLRILSQFKDFLVIILLIAAIVSMFFGNGIKDAIIIIGILIVNMIIGITQENRADNALKELKNLSNPKAKVKRDGQVEKIDSENVVLGDIVILDSGDYIPADLRIIESINLKIDESALTGESMPVEKDARTVLENGTGLGDRINVASMGTVVTYGRGKGVVYATGMETEMGKIATLLDKTAEANTPLQDKLNSLAKTLGVICIVICACIFGIGLLYGMNPLELLMVSVSLAVAAVPEGIAIVATVILAIGVQKMVRANVIVKKLRAVETLGSTTVICSDKTGTMTQNKMTVVKVFDTANVYEVTGTGYSAAGEIVANHRLITKNIPLMSEIATLCNDSIYDKENAKIIGDPTEAAMLVFGAKLGINKDQLNTQYERVLEIPFDSDRKLMSTYNLKNGKVIMNTKGASDAIIKRSTSVYQDGEIIAMTDDIRQRLLNQNSLFALQALRVLGFAYKEYAGETSIDNVEENLIYVGMMCMIDPPRDEVKESIAQCHNAGITVKMITGDHKNTAGAIAESLGIMEIGDAVLDGNDLDNLNDEQLKKSVNSVNVFARVSPEHKVRIVTAVKENNNIVAMTGDGVNDAPSLKKADIGIAMGIAGTDVAKEVSDMILTDDNFVSIVSAIERGRIIYGNIRKVTGYLLGCNMGEILIILLAIIAGLPVPLVATQLLFVNLLTDALPAFALGMEDKEPGVMNKQPRDPKEPIINKELRSSVAFRAIFLCAGVLGSFLYGLNLHSYETAVSMCFFTLVAGELLFTYTSKTDSFAGFKRSLFANRFLNISIALSFVILMAVMYVPFLNEMFTTTPLGASQIAICSIFMAMAIFGSELARRFCNISTPKPLSETSST
ncbi:MAG: cation-translocating P-type ATPase [Dehalococcoidia bacterium]|nr:cation-translocating P-type ATPase [Dehalococcoidia bacterium]